MVYVTVFVFMTTLLTFAITYLIMTNYSFYSMYFKPGIYVFESGGGYYYYPSGSPNPNVTLIVLGGGKIEVDDCPYLNASDVLTVQPGYHTVTVMPGTQLSDYITSTLPVSALISLIIVLMLRKLLR